MFLRKGLQEKSSCAETTKTQKKNSSCCLHIGTVFYFGYVFTKLQNSLTRGINLYQSGFDLSNIDLEHLTSLTKKALRAPHISHTIELLKREIIESEEPFIWRVLSEQLLGEAFPNGIQSGWIFVLKPNTHTPSHYHPNSIQYTAVIEGTGKIKIGREEKELQTFDPERRQPMWYVIPKNVPHAVITRDLAMVVFSFHTCPPGKLLEVETSSGRSRFYER